MITINSTEEEKIKVRIPVKIFVGFGVLVASITCTLVLLGEL